MIQGPWHKLKQYHWPESERATSQVPSLIWLSLKQRLETNNSWLFLRFLLSMHSVSQSCKNMPISMHCCESDKGFHRDRPAPAMIRCDSPQSNAKPFSGKTLPQRSCNLEKLELRTCKHLWRQSSVKHMFVQWQKNLRIQVAVKLQSKTSANQLTTCIVSIWTCTAVSLRQLWLQYHRKRNCFITPLLWNTASLLYMVRKHCWESCDCNASSKKQGSVALFPKAAELSLRQFWSQ